MIVSLGVAKRQLAVPLKLNIADRPKQAVVLSNSPHKADRRGLDMVR